MEANSHPMAPPPMTATDVGMRSKVEELVGGDHGLAVDLEARKGPGHRPRRQHHVAPLHHSCPASGSVDDLHAPSGQQRARCRRGS